MQTPISRRPFVALLYAAPCETVIAQLELGPNDLVSVSSVNGRTEISALAEELARMRSPKADHELGSDPLKDQRRELDEAHWSVAYVTREDPWRLDQMTSYDDGSAILELAGPSIEKENNNMDTAAYLYIVCKKGVISVQIGRPELVFAPAYMWVSYRVGNGAAKSRRWPNVKYKGLGLWSSEDSIPFLRELLDQDRLLMNVRVDKKDAVRLTFELHNLRQSLEPLARACHWEMPRN